MRATFAIVLVTALVAIPAGAADRVVLQSGGAIEVTRWWYEGDDVKLETTSGILAVPRSMVVRIEKGGSPRGGGSPAAGVPFQRNRPSDDSAKLMGLLDDGSRALEARDYDTAMRRFHEAIRLDPSRSDARTGYALAETALGRDAAALAVVLDGLALDPSSADLHEVLGDLRDREERVAEALTSWREAFRLAPNDRRRDKILKGEREFAAGRDYAFSAAAHFNILYDGDVDPDLAEAVEEYLEQCYRDLSSLYRHAPSQPVTVILYPRAAFHAVTQAADSVGGLFDGKIRLPLGGLRRLEDPARRVLSHELAHAFVHARSRGNCPRWLHEGLAQLAEQRPSGRVEKAEVEAVVAAADPLAWMREKLSYPAALSLTRFLEERRGFDALVRALERLGRGETLDEAFRAEFSADSRELAWSWIASVREAASK